MRRIFQERLSRAEQSLEIGDVRRQVFAKQRVGTQALGPWGGRRLVKVLFVDPVVVVNAALVVQSSNEAELQMLTTQARRLSCLTHPPRCGHHGATPGPGPVGL